MISYHRQMIGKKREILENAISGNESLQRSKKQGLTELLFDVDQATQQSIPLKKSQVCEVFNALDNIIVTRVQQPLR